MATVNSTVTIDTGEWLYVDVTGITHTVTNAQTFQLRIDDNGTADVRYYLAVDQTPITCTDGTSLTFRPQTAMASGTAGNEYRMVAPLTDAGQGSDFYSLRGEICIECPVSGVVQNWTVAKMNPSDADFGAAGTITMTLEDQYGHVMVMPFTGSGITVAQAA
jgi:hypothetical protein